MALTINSPASLSGGSVTEYNELSQADTNPSPLKPGGSGTVACFVQAIGSFGGGTLNIQGSNNGTDWVNLSDITGTPIAFTAAGGVEMTSSALYIRPILTGGSGGDVDVIFCLRG